MKSVNIQNSGQPLKSPIKATYCDSFFCQLRGLMFRRSLAPNEGLLLVQKRENRSESAIHMLFMFIDLTVVWLNASKQVVDVKFARRWRLFYAPQTPAKYVLELPCEYHGVFQIGDQLQFDEEAKLD
jgi:uncharacterized membrane protein (UPF0127 family)